MVAFNMQVSHLSPSRDLFLKFLCYMHFIHLVLLLYLVFIFENVVDMHIFVSLFLNKSNSGLRCSIT